MQRAVHPARRAPALDALYQGVAHVLFGRRQNGGDAWTGEAVGRVYSWEEEERGRRQRERVAAKNLGQQDNAGKSGVATRGAPLEVTAFEVMALEAVRCMTCSLSRSAPFALASTR